MLLVHQLSVMNICSDGLSRVQYLRQAVVLHNPIILFKEGRNYEKHHITLGPFWVAFSQDLALAT